MTWKPLLRPQHTGLAACLLLLLVKGTAGAAAPPSSPPLSEGDSSEISVTVVEIPVEVSRGEKPVEGLQAADFEVLENGKPLPIISSEAIELRDGQTGKPAPATPGTGVSEAATPPPPQAQRHLFLLFDFALSTPERQAEGIAASRRMVADSLDPSDLVGVGVYLPKGSLPILLPFTADRAAVDRTLDALAGLLTGKKPAVTGKDDPLRLLGADARRMLAQQNQTREMNHAAQMLDDFGESAEEALGGASIMAMNDNEVRQRDHIMALIESLAGLGEYLRPVEGRKYLAFFSGGFVSTLVQRPTMGVTDANLGGSALIAKLDETLDNLKHLGWVIHAANLKTLHGGGLNGDGLFILANKTGGMLVEGGNNLAPGLARAMSQSAHSYLLTVQVDVPADGAYHPLEVRLRTRTRGTQIIHRGGYFAPKRTGA